MHMSGEISGLGVVTVNGEKYKCKQKSTLSIEGNLTTDRKRIKISEPTF